MEASRNTRGLPYGELRRPPRGLHDMSPFWVALIALSVGATSMVAIIAATVATRRYLSEAPFATPGMAWLAFMVFGPGLAALCFSLANWMRR